MDLKTLSAATALALVGASGASAAPLYASDLDIVVDGPRGTANDRDDPTNALGSTLGDFFELGVGATVDFTFGDLFTGFVNIVEVTFGNVLTYPESVLVSVGRDGVFTALGPLLNADAQGPSGFTFDLDGTYDTVRLTDTTTFAPSRGFDVDRIGVSPVPLPAAGLLLAGAVGALAFASRRRAA